MFQLTQEEIDGIKSNLFYELKAGFDYTMIITGVDEREDKSIWIKTVIASEEGKGQPFTIFIKDNSIGKQTIFQLMLCWFTTNDMVTGISYGDMVGKMFSAKSVASSPNKEGKTFVNLRGFKAVSEVPSFEEATTIPTEQTEKAINDIFGSNVNEQVEASKDLF
jgi:hypothetical protein